jgi:hypothetical protein
VGEFPELQGIAGTYYARLEGENHEVAEALGEQYLPNLLVMFYHKPRQVQRLPLQIV